MDGAGFIGVGERLLYVRGRLPGRFLGRFMDRFMGRLRVWGIGKFDFDFGRRISYQGWGDSCFRTK